jgi:hypothetical protein
VNICLAHWRGVCESYGYSEITDFDQRLAKVRNIWRGDPFSLSAIEAFPAACEVIVSRTAQEDLPLQVEDIAYDIETKASGCPICFVGIEGFVRTIDRVKQRLGAGTTH